MMTYSGATLSAVEGEAYARFPRLAGAAQADRGDALGRRAADARDGARAWRRDPALLLLDELSMGLAPIIVEELYELVAQIAREGVSILVVEQFASTVLGVADLAAVLVHGKVARRRAPRASCRTNCRRRTSAASRGETRSDTTMIEHPERVEQFKRDIAEMQVKDPAAGRDRLALRGGFTLMMIGVIVTIVGYVQSHDTSNPLSAERRADHRARSASR